MRITIFHKTKYNYGKSKCGKCKEPFEHLDKQVEVEHNDSKVCAYCGEKLLRAKIEEYSLLLEELLEGAGNDTI